MGAKVELLLIDTIDLVVMTLSPLEKTSSKRNFVWLRKMELLNRMVIVVKMFGRFLSSFQH